MGWKDVTTAVCETSRPKGDGRMFGGSSCGHSIWEGDYQHGEWICGVELRSLKWRLGLAWVGHDGEDCNGVWLALKGWRRRDWKLGKPFRQARPVTVGEQRW